MSRKEIIELVVAGIPGLDRGHGLLPLQSPEEKERKPACDSG
jgi:hypothetical protein